MFSLNMITFRKSSGCPSSQDLLAFQKGEAGSTTSRRIESHVCDCDFCQAEVDFYARFPQGDDAVVVADIPPHLYELAEALLGNNKKKFSLLNKLVNGKENLQKEPA